MVGDFVFELDGLLLMLKLHGLLLLIKLLFHLVILLPQFLNDFLRPLRLPISLLLLLLPFLSLRKRQLVIFFLLLLESEFVLHLHVAKAAL